MTISLKQTLAACALAAASLAAHAGEVTFTAGTDTGATSVTKDGTTVTMTDMSGGSYYICGTAQQLEIASAGIITKVVLTFTTSGTSNYGPTSFYGGSYTPSGDKGTWTGSATSMSLKANSEARVTSIAVTYKDAGDFSFEETFDNVTGFSGTTLTGSDVSGWSVSGSVNQASDTNGRNNTKAVYLGSSGSSGSLTTPALTTLPDVAILRFYCKKLDSGSTLTLSGTNCTLSETSFTAGSSYKEHTVIVNRASSGNPKITFSASASKRVYLDDVTITLGYSSVTVTSARYATFCDTYASDFSSTGITVYKVKVEGGVAKMTAVESGKVPAGEGVVLYKDVEGAEAIAVPKTASATTISDNEMVGVTERVTVCKSGGTGMYNYILQSDGSGGATFNMALDEGAYMPAGRAYLSTAYDATAVGSRLSVAFDEAQTADAATPKAAAAATHAVYDMQGRRLAAAGHKKGRVLIVDGKKTKTK